MESDLSRVMGWNLSSPGIELLKALARSGSINSAARSVGMGYKTAWQKLEQINNLLPYPVVQKQTGGSGGGGTELTREGRLLLRRITLLQKEFALFLQFFSDEPEEALATLKTLRRIEMKISARNVWLGQVELIERGVVNSVVTIALKGGDRICSVITDNSVNRLELAPGKDVLVIVKASCVLLGRDIAPESISARNILTGTIAAIVPGAVNDEVTIELAGGSTVTSIITSASVKRLGLVSGAQLSAIIKASDVLLAVA